MAGSAIAVVQQACSLLAVDIPQDFDDGDAGPDAAVHYEEVVAELISKHPWRFAMRKVQLLLDDEDPVNEWTYSYALPADRVGDIVAVFDTTAIGAPPLKEYEIFGASLYTDAGTIYVDYKVRPAEAAWPPYFTAIVKHHMAALLAPILRDSQSLAETHMAIAYGSPQENGNGGLVQAARRQNAFQEPPKQLTEFPLITARFGGMP